MSGKATKSAALARWRNRKKPQATGIPRLPEGTFAPLSYGQQRLWFLQEMQPENPFYNYAETYRLRGNLNVEHLLKSLDNVAQRHDILRTTFELNDESIHQVIHKNSQFKITEFDLQNNPNAEPEAKKIAFREASKHFELTANSLTRITLIKLAQNDHLLLVTMHHIITDKWSMRIFRDELATAYRAFQNGEKPLENPLQIQYADYAYWQKNQALADDKSLNYWKQKLAGELPTLTLPTDHPTPTNPSFKGNYASQTFSAELSQQLKSLSQENNTTLFVLLLTAYKILLHRYAGQDDILVGTPFANRDKKELEALIGFFNETLVLRSDLSENPTFIDLLAQVRTTVLDAFSHKNTPFETLVKILQPERKTAVNPIFQVMFLYHDVPPTPAFSSDLYLTHEPFDLGVTKFDLTLYVSNDAEQLTAIFEYATDRFDPETILRMHTHLQVLLQEIVNNPNQKIAQLPILSEVEKQAILYDWNTSKSKSSDIFKMSDDSTSIIDIFQKNVQNTPNNIAVKADNQSLTYTELNQKSNALATELQALSIKKNTFIGLLTGRSIEMMIGILGIMKAGGAYLPLDPEYPAERIEFMLEDADVPVIVTQEKYTQNLPDTQANILKFEDIKVSGQTSPFVPIAIGGGVSKGNFAYIIYTSGSTGKPKGVPVTHQNLLDSTLARFDYYSQHPGCFLLMSSFAFDSSVAGIFWAITSGGTLLIPPRRIEQDTEQLNDIIYENKVTHTLLLPSLYDTLLQFSASEKLASLNTVMVAGEACPPSLVARHFEQLPQTKLYNEYGPTEATVWCTVHEIKPEDAQRVPIGRPTSNADIYILDTHLQPVPVNVVGELYVGGSGVTQGYHNRADLTKLRFLSNPFSHTHPRMYRTGDLARYRADGTINFLGRADQQVKIRGYRIEPGEIAAVIKQHPKVKDVVVTVQKNEQRLIAYFLQNEIVETDELKLFLKSQLPEYMLPSVWVLLDDFPRLPNGKINLNALPEAQYSPSQNGTNFIAPRNVTEQKLVKIWEQVLNVQPIGIRDNFFEIGGDSILSIQIVAKARKAGLALKANQLFEHQSIAELALFVAAPANAPVQRKIYTGEVALTPIQYWFFDSYHAAPQHWNMAMQVNVDSIISPDIVQKSVSHLIEVNDALRLNFEIDKMSDIFKISDIRASVLPPEKINAFQYFDYKNISIDELENEIKIQASLIHSNLNLERGSLFQVAYFDCPATHSNIVLFIAHHLIVDVVSWQIIIEEFKEICSQIIDNKGIKLTQKLITFKDWSTHLASLATQNYFKDELVFWQKHNKANTDFPSDFEYNLPIEEQDIKDVIFELDIETTTKLLQEANASYSTKTDEILLTALLQTFFNFTNKNEIQIALERHGRDAFDGIDVTNTVGWFTSFFPLNLALEEPTNIGRSLKAVKEQIRAVPNSGIGYGVLRYLQNELPSSKQVAPIIFNYLGNQKTNETGIFSAVKMVFENARHPQSERHNLLEINAQIKGGKLETRWSYSPKIHRTENINNLLINFEKNLRSIIKHCQNIERQYTPSDFSEVNLNEANLEKIIRISPPINHSNITIENIFSLSFIQNTLLFHHLQGGNDEGLLHVACVLHGELNETLFKEACRAIAQRHSALRTSIHWQEIEQPLQIVFSEVDLDIQVLDWRSVSQDNFNEKLITFKKEDAEKGLNLSRGSVNRFTLIQTENNEYQLVWLCHHILLDGWSAVIILKDIIESYAAKIENRLLQLEAIPSYVSYLKWLKKQDKNLAQKFWKGYFSGFASPTLVGENAVNTQQKNQLTDYDFSLSKKITDALHTHARTHRLTLNTLIQGAWAILLSRLTENDDVVFGTTISGRNADLPNIDLMAGLFMNVLPVRMKFDAKKSLKELLNQLQTNQLQTIDYGYINLNEVNSFANISGQTALFDSLMVFENFPWSDLEGGGLVVKNFKGGITTTYPLTIVVVPGDALQFHIRYDAAQVPISTIEWISKGFEIIFSSIIENLSIADLHEHIEKPVLTGINRNLSPYFNANEKYIAPQNQTQLKLVQIWEELFARNPIGIQENFFEIGGTSLMAVRLLSKIEEKLGYNLPPATLLQHNNIEALSKILKSNELAWSTLVPLRASGSHKPLFCIHAGGGHILFYKDLVDNLKDIPVYAVQPEGLDGSDFGYASIEEMTAHYLREMREIQPKGPYYILGTCFSNSVSYEMVKQLEAVGETVAMLIIVDSAPGFLVTERKQHKGKLERWIDRVKKEGWRVTLGAIQNRLLDKVIDKEELHKQRLQRVQFSLKTLYDAYEWKPYEMKIILARSEEFAEREDKWFHIETWKHLTGREPDAFVVPTSHGGLFDEGAEAMAKELQKRIDDGRKED